MSILQEMENKATVCRSFLFWFSIKYSPLLLSFCRWSLEGIKNCCGRFVFSFLFGEHLQHFFAFMYLLLMKWIYLQNTIFFYYIFSLFVSHVAILLSSSSFFIKKVSSHYLDSKIKINNSRKLTPILYPMLLNIKNCRIYKKNFLCFGTKFTTKENLKNHS